MKKSFFTLLLALMGTSVMAQSKFNVSGVILEDETNEVVISATVRILSLPDSTMVGGAATGTDGSFNIKGVKKGKYVTKITYVGYQDRLMPLDLTDQKDKDVNIGYIHITPDSKLLKEAKVTANVAQVQVSGDSIVYNAAAYRVAEGSVLEDLVKKLPGAKVDENGGITINGGTVTANNGSFNYGAAIGGRDYNSTDVSMQTLHDVYLPPFAAGIEAGAATVMTAFEDINGTPATANKYILKDILRDELGFKDCELIIDEWHYLPPKGWAGIRSADPDGQKEVWSGPTSHNGIDSSCFNLTVLSQMQTTMDAATPAGGASWTSASGSTRCITG